jgi:hypothetical protein
VAPLPCGRSCRTIVRTGIVWFVQGLQFLCALILVKCAERYQYHVMRRFEGTWIVTHRLTENVAVYTLTYRGYLCRRSHNATPESRRPLDLRDRTPLTTDPPAHHWVRRRWTCAAPPEVSPVLIDACSSPPSLPLNAHLFPPPSF